MLQSGEFCRPFQEYVNKGVDPLIYRYSNDPDVRRLNLGQIGHFTMMVNANSTKIGCGKVQSSKFPYRVIYGCNYTPNGNVFLGTPEGLVPLPAYQVAEGKKGEEGILHINK